jgi:uroporphyrinogen decarboxylase
MTKRERLAAVIAGRPVDRLPVALWRHFWGEETSRAGLVEAMVRWQTTGDWDFLKINPRASYHVEDWGNRYTRVASGQAAPVLVRAAVQTAEDFARLPRLDPMAHPGVNAGPGRRAAPVLGDHLGAVADLRAELGPDVPMIMTVFTPLAIAEELAGGPQRLQAILRASPDKVHAGLRTIAATFADFSARAVAAGADGIYLATTHTATRANFSVDEYAAFGRPYDLEVIAAVQGAPLNLLHVCQSQAMVRELADYPVSLINWDTADPTNPHLDEMVAAAPGKGLVGGLDRRAFMARDAAARIRAQAAEARRAMAGRPFVLASTCTIDPASDAEAVRAAREAAEGSQESRHG